MVAGLTSRLLLYKDLQKRGKLLFEVLFALPSAAVALTSARLSCRCPPTLLRSSAHALLPRAQNRTDWCRLTLKRPLNTTHPNTSRPC